jgi:hypothetical protein
MIVEGQTEETLVRDLLQEPLANRRVYVQVRRVETRRKQGRVYRGGMTTYGKAKRDIQRWLLYWSRIGSLLLSGSVDTMRIQEVGLDAHIWECGSQHRAGLRMFRHMKSELRLFVTLEPCFAAVRPTIPMRHHQDALGVMELARRGDLSEQEGTVAGILWRGKNFPAAGHRDDVNILEPHMPDKGVKDMPEAGIEAAEHKGGRLIWPRQIAGIEEDGC